MCQPIRVESVTYRDERHLRFSLIESAMISVAASGRVEQRQLYCDAHRCNDATQKTLRCRKNGARWAMRGEFLARRASVSAMQCHKKGTSSRSSSVCMGNVGGFSIIKHGECVCLNLIKNSQSFIMPSLSFAHNVDFHPHSLSRARLAESNTPSSTPISLRNKSIPLML